MGTTRLRKMMHDNIWGDASVTYDDWHGTAQLDHRSNVSLYELVGIDHNKWMIIGLDIGGGEQHHELRVLAIDRQYIPEGGDVLPKVAAMNNGEIPVTDFLIHDADPYEILRAITHAFDLRLRLKRTVDYPIRIEETADISEQE